MFTTDERPKILIVYDPRVRTVINLAESIAGGVIKSGGVPNLFSINNVGLNELLHADGIAIGCANWTGVTAAVKSWFDSLGHQWENGDLNGKVGAAFAVGDSPGAGLEFTLWSIIHWFMANGMIPVGLPWMEEMASGGSYYGATARANGIVSEKELNMARLLGKRLTLVTQSLKENRTLIKLGEDMRCTD